MNLLCSPVFVPQIELDPLLPPFKTEKLSHRHWVAVHAIAPFVASDTACKMINNCKFILLKTQTKLYIPSMYHKTEYFFILGRFFSKATVKMDIGRYPP